MTDLLMTSSTNKQFKKVLMIDNFDSFTYNLVDYFKVCGCEVKIFRNTVEPEVLDDEDFDLLVFSPGPSIPKNAGNMFQIIEKYYQTKPILGVCLGHQALIEFFGGTLKYVEPQHGKAAQIVTDQQSIYSNLPASIEVARYHSLAADKVPGVFEISARSADGTVMSIRHKFLPIEGVQYHPESVLSMKDEVGMKIIQNVVNGKISTGNVSYIGLMKKLQGDAFLKKDDINDFIKNIIENQLSEDQKLILLVAFSFKLKTPYFLNEFIQCLNEYSKVKNTQNLGKTGIDVCGTGGSNLPRINTSTLVALVLSHLGMPILKHGNRAASGRFGSFNLLESLDVPIHFEEEGINNAFSETNLAFIFAPDAHPVVGNFASSRARIGIPTIFNVLGPLLNPYNPVKQFIGTAFKEYMDLILETGILMGKEHVVVVRAEDGLDEISVSVPTLIKVFKNGEKQEYTFTPKDFGIEAVPFEKVKAEKAADSIAIAKKILKGELDSEHYKLIAVNAAYIYAQFYKEIPLTEAYNLMVETMKSGVLKKQLEKYNLSLQGRRKS